MPLVDAITGLGVADFDGDGRLDVVVASDHGSSIELVPGNGRSGFFPPVPIAIPTLPINAQYITGPIVVADFDGDGFPDFAVQNNGLLTLAINDGNANFSLTLFPMDANSNGLLSADLNSDGRPDLASPEGGAGPYDRKGVALFLNSGACWP